MDPAPSLSRLGLAAIWYAERRAWRVFPLHSIRDGRCTCGKTECKSPGKHPRVARGCSEASSDPDVIRRWWEAWPDANVGIATGQGLAVIDIDPRSGGDDGIVDLRRMYGELPETLEVLTGSGGRHIYLAVDFDADVRNSASALAPGVDVRGEGGYVVAPPSSHASGTDYAWEISSRPDDAVLGEVPATWLDAMRTRRLRAIKGGAKAATKDEPIAEGGRNDALMRRGCYLRAASFGSAGILAALLAENDARCNPPLDPAEVKAIAASVCRYAPGFPAEKAIAREVAREERAAEAPTDAAGADSEDDPDGWQRALIVGRNGALKKSYANTLTILSRDPDWRGRLAWNLKTQEIWLDDAPVDDARFGIERAAFERVHGYDPGEQNLWSALRAAASLHPVSPVEAYLKGLTWDGVPRLDSLASRALASPTPMAGTMIRKWFISAVARAMRPGCKVDTVLVLVGAQGWRKSTFFGVLGGAWFSDSHVDIGNKDAFLQFRSAWVLEWGEIERVTGRRGADEIKSILASRFDDYRPHYGRSMVRVPRSCVVVGTTNQEQFLDDETGSRRFWVLRVAQEIDAAALAAERDQLWAEARAAFDAGEEWWFDTAEDHERERTAEDHTIDSPWEQTLRTWIAEQDRGDFLTTELLTALAIPVRDHDDRRITRGVGRAMRRLGYHYQNVRAVRGGRQLGPVKAWVPKPDADGRVFGRGDAFEGLAAGVEGGDDA